MIEAPSSTNAVGTEESPSLLTVILDTNPVSWDSITDKLTLKSALESLSIGINAHLALNNSNRIAVLASHSDGTRFLYPRHEDPHQRQQASESQSRSATPENQSSNDSKTKYVTSQMYRQFKVVDETFISKVHELVEAEIPSKPPRNHLSSSLSMALAYINKSLTLNPEYKARILIVNITQDEHLKYIPIMNAIFAAQKMKISIDVCQLSGDATFLQQAADATNGVYLNVKSYDGLVQYFTTALFIDPSLRNIMVKPTSGNIDFRASCFLTGKVVDVGYVCSVCLCILSLIPEGNKCPACDSEFDNHVIMKLKRKPAVRPKKKKRKLDPTPSASETPPAKQAQTAPPASLAQ